MEKNVKIEGMMCPRCEMHVKKALEALPEVEKAEVSHKSGTAALSLNAEIDDAAIKTAIEEAGYKFVQS
ncbi:MAG: cation transporter [Oscillospiraceae bacterium]|nr:cation transporter [Oscillospiraceae bacterium]